MTSAGATGGGSTGAGVPLRGVPALGPVVLGLPVLAAVLGCVAGVAGGLFPAVAARRPRGRCWV